MGFQQVAGEFKKISNHGVPTCCHVLLPDVTVTLREGSDLRENSKQKVDSRYVSYKSGVVSKGLAGILGLSRYRKWIDPGEKHI